ncbi:hypothetical protein PR202_ga21558 [Eleusine coracana subsp. coracana]|uniref:Uncharacterized protein n=1 Tax=Eleusine coracana subsp. coracana TaxID=191504 RepID=A0AAV5CZG1_ELECO|nr:hypothetical protein PR202_ga21558 [Eleusine coracana subsp. coracana]
MFHLSSLVTHSLHIELCSLPAHLSSWHNFLDPWLRLQCHPSLDMRSCMQYLESCLGSFSQRQCLKIKMMTDDGH